MLRNRNYSDDFPFKDRRITLAYRSLFNQRNFVIRRFPFFSTISVGNRLSESAVDCIKGWLCEYQSEYDAMDRYMESHAREFAKQIGNLELSPTQ